MRSSSCARDRSATWTRCAATRAASGVHFEPSFVRSRRLRRTHPWKDRSSFVWPPRENEHAAPRLRALPNSYPIATDHAGVKPLHSALPDRPPTSPIRTQPTPLHPPQTQARRQLDSLPAKRRASEEGGVQPRARPAARRGRRRMLRLSPVFWSHATQPPMPTRSRRLRDEGPSRLSYAACAKHEKKNSVTRLANEQKAAPSATSDIAPTRDHPTQIIRGCLPTLTFPPRKKD